MPNIGAQDWLLSGISASGTGRPMDCRNALNAAYHTFWSIGSSAILVLEASPDGFTGWANVATVTAIGTVVTAQVAGFFPFVRGGFSTGWAGATAYQHFAPELTQRY
jgi:hypothetical protein